MKKIITAVLALSLLCACGSKDDKISTADVSGEMSVTILKAGQADAIILQTQNHTVLIDCGEKDDGDEVAEELQKNGTDSVDYMFITHFDKDHVGGVPEVLDSFSVGEIVTPDYIGNNDEYEAYTEALAEHNLSASALTEDMSFELDGAVFNVYPPLKSEYNEDDNNFSLVIRVTYGENSFLFAGDAKKERLEELKTQLDLKSDFVKMPHHGRYNKGTKAFVQSVMPKYAVITDSEKNPAADETLAALKGIGCGVYETKNGGVYITSDGKNMKISQIN